jgi:O-succinylbenzoic acid--CoA ligase
VLVPLDPSQPAPGALERLPDGEEARVRLKDEVDPAAIHSVIHTSGTSGEPKPVELTYANHHASALASAKVLRVEPDDAWLCPLPLFHVGGLAVLLRSAMYGTTAIVHERFDAVRVRDALASGEATLASLVPTMLRRVADAGLEKAPRLRALLLGGGPVPSELLDWARERGLPVRATYGMTEAASQIATAEAWERAGRPLPGVELRIADDGEILVRGPIVAPRDLGPDGWLHTADFGRLDDRGRLHVEGRLDEVIVTGGENVAAARIEAALLTHPAVADAAVAGRPDPEWGEAVTAWVVLAEPADDEELRAFLRERLRGPEVPKAFVRLAELPRTAAGKVARSRLE